MQWNWLSTPKLALAAMLLALVAGDSLARPGDRLFGRSRSNYSTPTYTQPTYTQPTYTQPVQPAQVTQPVQPGMQATQPVVQQPVVPQYTTTRRGLFGRRTQQVVQTPVQQYVPASPAAGTPTDNRQSFYPAPVGTQSLIEVRLPIANAEVNFDGTATTQTGANRLFITPALDAQRDNVYQVTARWTDNGNPVEQKREVKVTPGARVLVDFTQAQAQPPAAPPPAVVPPPAPLPGLEPPAPAQEP